MRDRKKARKPEDVFPAGHYVLGLRDDHVVHAAADHVSDDGHPTKAINQ